MSRISLLLPVFLIPNLLFAIPGKVVTKTIQGFVENKGQIFDQNYQPNPAVKFLFTGKGLNVQIREGGFSYEIVRTDSSTNMEVIRKAHRIDVDFVGCKVHG